jgi:MFS family permease
MPQATGSAVDTPPALLGGDRAVLAGLLISQALIGLDATATVLAGPLIERQLHLGVSTFNLAVACYQLALGSLIVTSGRLGDRFGSQRLLRLALIGFAATSIVTALSTSAVQLVLARAAQGAAAALISPQIYAIIKRRYEGQQLARTLGLVASVIGASGLVGPLAGGLLLSTGPSGWRLIYAVNLPLGAFVLACITRLPKEGEAAPHAQSMDAPGVLLLPSALLAVLLPLFVPSLRRGPVLPLLLVTALLLAVLLWRVERRKTRERRDPLLDARVIGSRRFLLALLAGAAAFFAMGGYALAIPQYLQREIGLRPLAAALVIACSPVGSSATSLAAGRLERLLGARRLPIGALITLVSVIGMAVAAAGLRPGWIPVAFGLLAFLSGVGLGVMLPALSFVIMSAIPRNAAGAGNGVAMTNQMLARGVGYSVLGALYASLYPRSGTSPPSSFGWLLLVLVACFSVAACVGLVLRSARSRLESAGLGENPA